MRSKAKLQKWYEAALKDGWVKGPDKRNKQSRATYFEMFKDGNRAFLWFGERAENHVLKLNGPNGEYEPSGCGQKDGYNYEAFLQAIIGCNKCRTPDVPLRQFGLCNKLCEKCIEGIEDYAKKHPQQPRTYVGTAKIEFRHVRGRVATHKVMEYRVLCSIDGKENRSYFEPYNGTNKSEAWTRSSATQSALSCAGYKIENIEKHTTWNGGEISKSKK